jgi:hypothetical protein
MVLVLLFLAYHVFHDPLEFAFYELPLYQKFRAVPRYYLRRNLLIFFMHKINNSKIIN